MWPDVIWILGWTWAVTAGWAAVLYSIWLFGVEYAWWIATMGVIPWIAMAILTRKAVKTIERIAHEGGS